MQLILNTAASINFDDPIRDALMINYFGAKRVLDLAHESPNLIAMHHVSTSYVNCNMPNNTISYEEIMPWPVENWEQWVDGLMKMEPQMLEKEEPNILKKFKFPNTYTLTKNLAE